MKSALKRIAPASLVRFFDLREETRELAKLEQRSCNTASLRSDLPKLANSIPASEWASVERELAPLAMGDKSGAVNPGDRRAIYSLARLLKPQSVLEVGTHLGASTSMLALAMKNSGVQSPRLVTVDIRDVNGPEGAWVHLKSKQSPRSAMSALNCDFVEFVTSPSVDFLNSCSERFDLIFLDGGHEATTVYQEVPAALKLLNPNGLILLHDVYPHNRPLWSDGVVVPGPWLAIERFRNEGATMRIEPLGGLPWPTKLNSNVTSLACLVRS